MRTASAVMSSVGKFSKARQDGERVAAVGFAPAEERNDRRPGHLGDLAGGGVGDGGHAEEGEDLRARGALALVRRIPDRVAGAQRAHEALQVVEMHGDGHLALALATHDVREDGIVGVAIEATHAEGVDHQPAADFQRGEMGGEQQGAMTAGDRALEMLRAR